jgi:hypothetical protein
VDKTLIERIRSFTNPPAIIAKIMDMILVMIGKNHFPEAFANRESSIDRHDIKNKDKKKITTTTTTSNKPSNIDF